MVNPFNMLLDQQQPAGADLLLATVAAVTADGLSLIPDGETEATQKKYKYMTSAYAAPAVGDRVVVMRLSGTYVVLGRIGSSTPDSEKYVRRSGDTMTGLLNINRSSPGVIGKNTIRDSSETVAENTNSYGFRINDKNGNAVALYTDRYETTGENGAYLGGYRMVDGSLIGNALRLLVTAAGGRAVYVTAPAAWRKALQLGSASGAFPLTIAQGGTGATTAAAARNNLGLGNTTGALPIANGGTGQTGTAITTTVASILTPASGFSIDQASFAQYGKLAVITAQITAVNAVTSSGWTTWATIVSGKRPAFSVVAQHTRTSYCIIHDNGNISVASTVSAGSTYLVSAAYLLP